MRHNATARLVFSALMCALLCVLSQIQIPLPPVPLSLSLLAVHLCGALMPPRWSAASVAAYLVLGAAGVPVFAGFVSGPAALLGPTGGYLWGYVLCAALEGLLLRRLGRTRMALMLSMALGTLACYALGTIWFMHTSGAPLMSALLSCVVPFLPGDALKILLAGSLCLRLQKPLSLMGLSP